MALNTSENVDKSQEKLESDETDDTVLDDSKVLSDTQAIVDVERSNDSAETEQPDKPLSWLPYELLQKIWKDLTFKDLKNMRCVSNWWRIQLNLAGIFIFKTNVTSSSELQALLAASCPLEFVKIEGKTTKIMFIGSDTENFPMIQEVIIGSKISPEAIKNMLKCLAWNLESLTFDQFALEDAQAESLTTTLGGLEWPKLGALTLVIYLYTNNATALSENMLCFLNFAKLPTIKKVEFKLDYPGGCSTSLRNPVQKLFSGFYSFVQAHVETLSDLSYQLISIDRQLPIPRVPDSLNNALEAKSNLQAFEIETRMTSVYEDALDLLMNLGSMLKKIKVVWRQNLVSQKCSIQIDKKKLENIIRKHGQSLEELEFDLQEGQRVCEEWQTGLDLKIFHESCPRLETLSLKIVCTGSAYTEQLQIPTLKNVSVQGDDYWALVLAEANGARIQRLTIWEAKRDCSPESFYKSFPALTYLHIQNMNTAAFRNFLWENTQLHFEMKEFKTTFGTLLVYFTYFGELHTIFDIYKRIKSEMPALELLTVFGIVVESIYLISLSEMQNLKKICFDTCGEGIEEFCRVYTRRRLTLRVTQKSKTQSRDIYEVWFNKCQIQN